MTYFTIFRIRYDWYDGEHNEALIAKEISKESFEEDLLKAKEFAKGLIGKKVQGDYLGKGYRVECLPAYYEQILWHLTNKSGYIYCDFYEDVEYSVEDDNPLTIIRTEKKSERNELT